MRTARLGDTGIETTVLGLGCADLFRQPRHARRRLLAAAFDAGIRHFDVAPMYGLGLAEGELGRFVQRIRDRVVVATKFGIEPTFAARPVALAQAPLRRVSSSRSGGADGSAVVAVDARAGKRGALLYRTTGYDANAARKSLERSLRALKSDYVDVLFLHDPHPGDVRSNDVRAFLDAARDGGKIRTWGVAGEPDAVEDADRRLDHAVPVLQLRADIFTRGRFDVLDRGRPTIVFGVIGQALARIVHAIRADDTLARRFADLGVGPQTSDGVAALLLRDALRENHGLPVVFSSVRAERIRAAVAAAEAPVDEDRIVEAFAQLVAERIGSPESRR